MAKRSASEMVCTHTCTPPGPLALCAPVLPSHCCFFACSRGVVWSRHVLPVGEPDHQLHQRRVQAVRLWGLPGRCCTCDPRGCGPCDAVHRRRTSPCPAVCPLTQHSVINFNQALCPVRSAASSRWLRMPCVLAVCQVVRCCPKPHWARVAGGGLAWRLRGCA